MNRNVFMLLASLPVIFLAACSNFDSRFARGVRASGRDDRFSGTYEGQWTSSSHPGGSGKLWCILTRVEQASGAHPGQGDAAYLAEFRATWHGIFSSQHSVVLHTKRTRSTARSRTFTGTAALKNFIGAGTYRCEGAMDGSRLRASYDASYDRGTFDVKRVSVEGGAPPSP